ncbi:MAG: TonB family protein [Crocinitomicaceae bacterium]|jgi:TonB family protein
MLKRKISKATEIMLIKILLSIILSFSLSQTSFGLELNGLGSYQQLRKEFYIGALYLTEQESDPAVIKASNTNKRMTLKVTTKRWSPRRWSLQWQNDIAINNSFADDPDLTQQLMTFTGFLGAKLISGDEIIIDYIAATGTVIKINNVRIIETKTAQLFNYLLNIWIGKLPPSGEFKKRILGQKDTTTETLLNRYNAITYNQSRSALVASWIKSREDALLAKQRKKDQAKKSILVKAQQARDTANKQAQASIAAAAKITAINKTYQLPKVIAKNKVINEKKKIASIASSQSGTKSKTVVATENKYYLDLYRWELIREIRNAIEYPEWAKKFGQKGDVTINFLVNRKAEVNKVESDNPDISILLVSEVHRAILAVVPFILAPDALAGNNWPMSITYSFNPKSDQQVFIKKPKKPNSLISTKKITRAEYKTALNRYIDDVTDRINDSIEYPVWAKKLKQKGNVIIEITINADGTISKMIDKDVSRYETLNQEVRDAIEQSTPLPAIPSELKLNTTTIVIEHEFK